MCMFINAFVLWLKIKKPHKEQKYDSVCLVLGVELDNTPPNSTDFLKNFFKIKFIFIAVQLFYLTTTGNI